MERFRSVVVFMFGTPLRAKISAGSIAVFILVVAPGVLAFIIQRLLIAFAPLFSLIVVVLVFGIAFRKIFGGLLPKPKKK
ncbi:MAG TPA: hypothetical protein VMQ44_01805 [Candidatus Saccharimonadales bacterium]|nr:hypothetical protein [Candidatus Saccharimonadales bacterium]